MKKINAANNKDRIVCVTTPGCHQLYYQPYRTKDLFWLFDTKDFFGSIYAFFRSYGIRSNSGYSLTLQQIYGKKHMCHNIVLSKMMERIPTQVSFMIREYVNGEHINAEDGKDRLEQSATPLEGYSYTDSFKCERAA